MTSEVVTMPPANSNETKLLEAIARLQMQCEGMSRDINEKYALLRESIDERYGHIEAKLEKTNHLLMNTDTGLVIRIDRLEQLGLERLEKRVSLIEDGATRLGRFLWIVIAAIVAAAVGLFFKK